MTSLCAAALFLAAAAALPVFGGGRKPPAEAKPAAPRLTAPVPPEPAARAAEPAESPAPAASGEPVYLAEIPNPNDFVLFANGGGWDGNWFVGYKSCWVSKLPPAPAGEYARAFVGAKLGRMKTEPIPGRPSWEKRPIPGQVDVAIAQEPLWPQSHRFPLTATRDVPLEGDAESAVEGVGESRWFWVEVPLKYVSTETDNYLALFSPSETLTDAAHAPILAAGMGDTRPNTWLNSSVKGEPPFTREEALKTQVTYFDPAIAIKLVPPNDRRVQVAWKDAPEGVPVIEDKLLLSADVKGEAIESAWVEFSTDTKTWRRAAGPVANPPYSFTVKAAALLEGAVDLRAVAADQWENRGVGPVLSVLVPPRVKKR